MSTDAHSHLRPSRSRIPLLLVAASLCSGCESDPLGPGPTRLEIAVLSGDGQVALAGSVLPQVFEVRVRETANDEPAEGVEVQWTVVAGDGASVVPGVSTTDEAGIASARLTLGASLGQYEVEAGFVGLTGPPARFSASAVLAPSLSGITPGPVRAGQTVELDGRNFGTQAPASTVFFSGIRGAVVSAMESRITATVPECLPSRTVAVTVRTGSLESNALELEVLEDGPALTLSPGEAFDLTDLTGSGCVKLAGVQGQEYLAVVTSASQVAAARWPYVLTGLVGAAPGAETTEGGGRSAPAWTARDDEGPQAAWDRMLRTREGRLARERGALPEGAARTAPGRVPAVGERREFQVLNADRGYTTVTAEVVLVGSRVVIYEDLEAPDPGLRAADFQALAADFDDPIFPTGREVFGEVSDLDANDRVVILFTPVVNALTARGEDGFVGGFFFGLDLLAGQANSNEAEIFYAMVPDPGAEFSDARSRELVMDVIPAILAHELQHMIAFNERIVVRGGTSQEALWLSEGMAQMAEDVVGDAFLERGDTNKGLQYKAGNWVRAARYLGDPADVSLIVTQGQGTLAERGGGWLFVRYIRDRAGGNGLLGELTRTTRIGVANVTAATGRSWEELFPDFGAALYLDGLGVATDDALVFAGLDLRQVIEMVETPYPLRPSTFDGRDFQITDDLWSSSVDFAIVRPPALGVAAVSLLEGNGSVASPTARMRLRLVRLK